MFITMNNIYFFQLLKNIGVFSLQNFWFILRLTWLNQIQVQYNNTEKSSYIRHITTGNNNDLQNICINNGLEQEIFFCTLSLVFNINIQINFITNNTHKMSKLNYCNNNNPTKIINIRKSASDGNIYEPWINPKSIDIKQQVCIYSK
jgi:hypothetical protein